MAAAAERVPPPENAIPRSAASGLMRFSSDVSGNSGAAAPDALTIGTRQKRVFRQPSHSSCAASRPAAAATTTAATIAYIVRFVIGLEPPRVSDGSASAPEQTGWLFHQLRDVDPGAEHVRVSIARRGNQRHVGVVAMDVGIGGVEESQAPP